MFTEPSHLHVNPAEAGAQGGKDLLNLTQPGEGGSPFGGQGRSETNPALCPSGLPGEGSLLPGPLAECLLGSKHSQVVSPPSTLGRVSSPFTSLTSGHPPVFRLNRTLLPLHTP